MSADAVGWVYRHSPYTGVTFQVHHAVADSVNDQHGNEFWMVKPKLAVKARTSVASAKRAMETLVSEGYLELLVESGGRGASRYRFLFPEGTAVVYESRTTGSPRTGSSDQPAHQEEPTGSPESKPDAHKERSQREPKVLVKPSSFPAQFLRTTAMIEWAMKNAPGVDLDYETHQFADYWRSRQDVKRTDWSLSWKTWIRKAHHDLQVKAAKAAPKDSGQFQTIVDQWQTA